MKKHVFLAMACMISVFATAQTYQNPVINRSLPDPTVIKGSDGAFYLYSTEDVRNVPVFRSDDLVHWVDGWPVVLGNHPSAGYQVPQMIK